MNVHSHFTGVCLTCTHSCMVMYLYVLPKALLPVCMKYTAQVEPQVTNVA